MTDDMNKPQRPQNPALADEITSLKRTAKRGEWRIWDFMLCLAIVPILMGGAWWLWEDKHAVRTIGWWVFFLANPLFAFAAVRAMHHADALKSVHQQYGLTVRGVIRPVLENYRTVYFFDQFTKVQIDAFRRMQFWGTVMAYALACLFGWGFTSMFFNQVVWK